MRPESYVPLHEEEKAIVSRLQFLEGALDLLGPENFQITFYYSGQNLKKFLNFVKAKQAEEIKESLKPKWNKPDSIPVVGLGEEEKYWVAVELNGQVRVWDALYQNRPAFDEKGEAYDFALVSEHGEEVDSVGWVQNKSHFDFENFYEPISFGESCVLLGWAEWSEPEFSGVES